MNDKTIPEIFFKREGRLNRLRYLKRNLVVGLVSAVIMFVVGLIFSDSMGNLSTAGNVIFFIITLAILVPTYCLMTRRFHDMDRDDLLAKVYIVGCAASYFLTFVLDYQFMPLSIVLLIVALYALVVPGTSGTNKYGANPLG